MNLALPSYCIPDFGLPTFGIPGNPSDSSQLIHETIIDFLYTIRGNEEAIDPSLYKIISNKYGLAYENIQNSYSYFNEVVIYTAAIKKVEAKLDLLRGLRSSSNEFASIKFVDQLLSSVAKLNNHVQDRSKKDLNTWLEENEIKVNRDWAILCSQTGIEINTSNIEN